MDDNILLIIISVCILFIIIVGVSFAFGLPHVESPERLAGRIGERFATNVIEEILNENDVLLTNVEITAEGKITELDNVIINPNGVFIIEVKNYYGELFGTEDDYEWIKNKITSTGNIYQQVVKNPIKQVKRQVYIMSRLLKEQGIDVWIEGYVFFVEMNSPVESPYVLVTQRDIDEVIHNGIENMLSQAEIREIETLLGY